MLLYVVGIAESGCGGKPCQRSSKFVLAVGEFFRADIPPVVHQEIKGVETWLTAMKKQISELRPAACIQTDDLTIEHSFPSKRQSEPFDKVRERVEGIPVAGD
jgi:hypothetical protein